MSRLFRESSLERVSSPERLDDYIKVSNPSVWMILGAIVLILVAGGVWACFGTLEDVQPGVLVVEDGAGVCYVDQALSDDLDAGGLAGRVPRIMQLEALECGAACLAMVCAYYGKWLPLEQVRRDCGVSRDGSSALAIVKAARRYGLDAKGYRFEPEALRDKGMFPCIVHWGFNHFVVVRGLKDGRVYLNDPARGKVRIDMDEFDRSFTGVALMFEPTDAFEPGGASASVRDFALERMRGTAAAVFIVITLVIASLLNLVNPVLSQVFTDRLLSGENPRVDGAVPGDRGRHRPYPGDRLGA